MLKEFIIYSDLHIGAPNEIIENSDNYSTNSQNSLMDNSEKRILTNRIIHKCIFNLTKNTVLLGDNFEIKNSKKGKLKNLIALRENIRKKCLKKGGIYLSGNHSVQMRDLYYKRGKVLFTHGDFVHYGKEKAIQVRNKKKGKSNLYWSMLKFIRKFYESRVNPLKIKYLQAAYTLAKKKNAKVVVMGHFHPRSVIDVDYNGIRMIIVPRGKTELNL